MHRFAVVFFVIIFMLGGLSRAAYATDCTQDTSADQFGDWFGTFGKQGMEKDQILAQRKAGRVAGCIQRKAGKAMKAAQKAGNDMKRNLGF